MCLLCGKGDSAAEVNTESFVFFYSHIGNSILPSLMRVRDLAGVRWLHFVCESRETVKLELTLVYQSLHCIMKSFWDLLRFLIMVALAFSRPIVLGNFNIHIDNE